jgi:hypothetical protein
MGVRSEEVDEPGIRDTDAGLCFLSSGFATNALKGTQYFLREWFSKKSLN